MARTLDEIESEVLTLTPPVRAALAKRLIASLDDLSEAEIERLWLEEAESRYDDFKAGRTSAVSGDDVFARARARKS
jgi:putative addiction module component (TIGR02574 family)